MTSVWTQESFPRHKKPTTPHEFAAREGQEDMKTGSRTPGFPVSKPPVFPPDCFSHALLGSEARRCLPRLCDNRGALSPRLPRARLPEPLVRLIVGLQAHRAFDFSAAIAFWFFLSLVPLLVLLGFVVGLVARSHGVDAWLAPVLDVVPGGAQEMVRSEVGRLAGSKGSLAPLGVIGFLWTASSGLHALMDACEVTARATRRAWWKQRAMALGWVLGGLAAACALAWVLVGVDGALHDARYDASPDDGTIEVAIAQTPARPSVAPLSEPRTGTPASRARSVLKARVHTVLESTAEQVTASAICLLLGLGLLAAFYRFAAERRPGVRPRVWPGVFTAVGSWLVVSWVFSLYVVSMASYALYYGGLAAVAVMLVWLYLTSAALALGAEVNAQLEAKARRYARSSGAAAKR